MSTLWRKGFTGSRVVLSVPSKALMFSTMELPPRSSGAPLDVIAKQELARSHKADAEQIEMTWWELPGGVRASEGTHAMAIGCRHADALGIIDAFESAGAEVDALDAGPLALVRAVMGLTRAGEGLTAIVDVGWSAATLLILLRGEIVYQRTISELGVKRLGESIRKNAGLENDADAEHLLLDPRGSGASSEDGSLDHGAARRLVGQHAEALAEELTTSINYSERRFDGACEQILATGGGSLVSALMSRVSRSQRVPLRVVKTEDMVGIGDGALSDASEWSLAQALGLSLRETAGGSAGGLAA